MRTIFLLLIMHLMTLLQISNAFQRIRIKDSFMGITKNDKLLFDDSANNFQGKFYEITDFENSNKNGSDENVNLYSYYGDLEGSLPKSIKNDSYQANNTNYRQNSKLIEHNEIMDKQHIKTVIMMIFFICVAGIICIFAYIISVLHFG